MYNTVNMLYSCFMILVAYPVLSFEKKKGLLCTIILQHPVSCFSFGSKVIGSRTGIIFNNEMDDFSTPGTVNAFNLPASPANYIRRSTFIKPVTIHSPQKDFLSMKWQWTYGPTLLPWNNHFHTSEACFKPL